MKLVIKDFCVRCGICDELHGSLFHFNLEKDCIELLHNEIPAELEDEAREAVKQCSIAAIHIVRE